jgi:4-hydroxy-4-methyl-2-oxoglutarate aldolase
METIEDQLAELTTPHLADGCLRTNVPVRFAPAGVRPLCDTMQCRGRARPVRHVGSLDAFLEAFDRVQADEVLVIDNGGRLDEACVGDIVILEGRAAGLAGFVIWGLHRDNRELAQIGFPVFSMGAVPTGPQRLHARPPDMFSRAMIGPHAITADDYVAADANGVLFLPRNRLSEIVAAATSYRETEARQLQAMREGRTYRSQIRFDDYLAERDGHPDYGFRHHLRALAAAGEV